MNKKVVLMVMLTSLAISLYADSLQRLSAIAAGTPWDVKAVGAYAYLTNRAATAIIDISDSMNPIVTFQTNGNPDTWSEGIDIVDSIVYVNHNGNIFWVGLAVPPDTIIYMTFFDLPNPALSPEPWGIEVRDTILYVAVGDKGLYIFNVVDPTNPTQIAFYDTPYNLTEFFSLDTLIYLADCDSMIILNISNPASPQYVGAVDIPTTCTDVYVVYPYAYATAYAFGNGTDGSIKIINVSDPTNPAIVGSINNIRGDPRAVFVNDNYIYCAAMDWWAVKENKGKTRADVEGGVRVAYGVTPDSLIISYDTPGDPREIFVRGNLLLVPDSDSLQILHHHKVGIEEHDSRARPIIESFVVYPNPTGYSVTCELQFRKPCNMSLSIYNELGCKIKVVHSGFVPAGKAMLSWDGTDERRKQVPQGTYFIKTHLSDPISEESEKVIYVGN